MCVAVRYLVDGQERVARCGERGARLPLVRRGGGLRLVEWGAGDDDGSIYLNPVDGPGRLLSLPRGYWVGLSEVRTDARWLGREAQPVKIAASAFMVSVPMPAPNEDQLSQRWVELRAGQFLQGALARIHTESRVYMVAVDAPIAYAGAYPFWPRVVASS